VAKKIEPTVSGAEGVETPVEKVRVYKVNNDSQVSFCGEKVQTDEDGREFFDLPAHTKELVDQHINLTWPE
jgi:hypothetical protein